MDLQELLARLENIDALSDEELAQLDTDLVAAFQELHSDTPTAEELAQLNDLRNGIAQVREVAATRSEAAETRRAEAAALLAEVTGETDPEDGGDADEVDDTGGEQPAEPAAPADGDEADDVEDAAQPVAASGTPARTPMRPRISNIAARRPRSHAPRPQEQTPIVITAAADIAGVSAGAELGGLLDVAQAMMRRKAAFRGASGRDENIPVATIHGPGSPILASAERHRFGTDAQANYAALQETIALVASGGICAPAAPRYDLANISTTARPLWDSLNQEAAERGAITFVPPPAFTAFDAAVDAWTVDNDENPSDPATKPCLHIDCDDPVTVQIEATTRCLEFGNLGARAWPEQVQDAIEKTMAVQARFAERRRLAEIAANSDAKTEGENFSAVRDTFDALERQATIQRNVHRTPRNFTIDVVGPAWWLPLARVDLSRELPGATAERLATADALLEEWFRVRNLNVTWLLEGEAGQDWGPQGPGAIDKWPSTAIFYMYHPGAHIGLDGGTLDLGIVRDSTLNETNDYRIFAETFEATAFTGLFSDKLTLDICPSGIVQAAADIDPCSLGS